MLCSFGIVATILRNASGGWHCLQRWCWPTATPSPIRRPLPHCISRGEQPTSKIHHQLHLYTTNQASAFSIASSQIILGSIHPSCSGPEHAHAPHDCARDGHFFIWVPHYCIALSFRAGHLLFVRRAPRALESCYYIY
ncbi:hypothetical protein K438DRAFT_155261 [Mycena galopus ATCC 62051]|nr:hypothetical protein K438DRAFT_155261 [Mycena galopus ATCC 62051]